MSCKSKDMAFEERRSRIATLIRQFREGEAFYTSKDFVESEVRSKFIDPFLECLKWDVKNEKGARHDKREVITEDRIVVEGQVKHPDYTLCYGGIKKIYVEAKQPSVNLKVDSAPALQVRRYAYSANMPIAILTDFQELAIYDARIKPSANDDAATARIEYLTYNQYVEKFEQLYNHISWEAIDLGKFDSYYEGLKEKRGTASIDNDILKMIETWRALLAEDIALHNVEMSEDALTSCVQKLIDRILFLRICEDKEIEPHKQLQRIIEKKKDIYTALKTLFVNCEKRFNAGLFKSDKFLDSLTVQDKSLYSIINELYYPICQYEFSVLPVEILGNIYEQFLGKVIRFKRKTKNGHSVEIVQKSEVQKAKGVYYTPSYIVDYIVKNTIGKKIEGSTPEKVSKLKICDPACGSGSFLVGAYQYLLDWHLDYYYDEKRRASSEAKGFIYKDASTHEWKLSIEEKRRILVNNIYGVDIDGQAVEVTKLSLFLKLLENEGKELSRDGTVSLFKTSELEKILPSMHKNIKCGNSLVGTDYFTRVDKQIEFTLEEQKSVNAFDWESEFSDVFANGGFDCVIGNPPYVKEYTNKNCFKPLHGHPCYQGKMDLWYFFGYLSIKIIKENGFVGLIAPNNWITNEGASLFRNFILDNAKILEYVDFGEYEVFETASIQTMIYTMEKTNNNEKYLVKYSRLNKGKAKLQEVLDFLSSGKEKKIIRFQAEISKNECKDKYILFLNKDTANILYHIKEQSNIRFEDREIITGIDVHQDFCNEAGALKLGDASMKGRGIFNLSNEEYNELNLSNEEKKLIKPFYTSKELHRYYADKENKLWVIYTDSKFKNKLKMKAYPKIKEHLDRFSKIITSDNKPYGLHRSRDEDFFKGVKIVSLRKTQLPSFTYTDFDCYVSQSYNIIKTTRFNLKSLTAILNSQLIKFWLKHKGKMQGNNFQVDKTPLLELPLITTSKEEDEKLTFLVDQMLDAHKQLATTTFEKDKKFLEQRIELLDKKIDSIVYELYGLSEDDIEIIEGDS